MDTAVSPRATEQTALRRILVVNPNGNPEVTRLVSDAATGVLDRATSARVLHPEGSPRSIETRADRAVAEPLAIDLLSRHPGYDAYVMACFDDIAVSGGRRFLEAPIVCAAEAAISVARLFAPRIAIVTTVDTMVPGIRALVAALGAGDICTVRAAGIGVASAAAGGAEISRKLDATIQDARNFDGAGAIILGSGGLTGRARALSARHGIPVIDSIEAALTMAEVAARLRTGQ
ncbi:MAG: aspartate/glutamate racemase family protein [Marinovum algicola]|jgi:allantoin racemase|uniref:Allantoin racemase n=1 Tax=Marinovum algicola TaxID=42444 RepID=A0A975ZPU8_9RHOB|nr:MULTISPECIES: aspartate/glutamate racemase family protein [Marinovum]MDD9745112.1 aspartate/glutamate racemase family protein [Marinovum sp. PR37]SEJ96008.1 allantoin racemase [Marinovum algicola]SLN68961.1 Asp/Glu/Hydantoin racemase [Marinovum algicola]